MPNAPRLFYDLSPYEWYTLFGMSYLNLTTFFHGTLLALKSNVPSIAFDTTRLGDGYTTKIQQVMGDMGLSSFFNSYEKGFSKEMILEEVDLILRQHDEIEAKIEHALDIESRKANSFFECLDKSVS